MHHTQTHPRPQPEKDGRLEYALAYAAQGWAVFPVARDKAPLVKWKLGENPPNADPQQVRKWWTRWPDANIGLRTGPETGLCTIDIDSPEGHGKDGAASIAKAEAENQPLPDTVVMRTQSGGTQRFYEYPREIAEGGFYTKTAVEILPGVDSKGRDGITILPPSVGVKGKYEWLVPPPTTDDDQPIEELPSWWLRLVRGRDAPPAEPSQRDAPLVANPVSPGIVFRCLAVLNPERAEKYDDWIAVGLALRHTATNPPVDVLAVWQAWSSQSSKYAPDECAAKWGSFGESGDRGNEIGLGSLIRWAREDSGDVTIGREPRTRATTKSQAAFPVAALPQPVRRYVLAASAAIGCDASFVALPLLSALTSAIGNARRIEIKTSWHEPAVLWTCIVGEPGTQKSPAFDAALRCLRARQGEAIRNYRTTLERHETEQADFDAAMGDWKKRGRRAGEPQPDEPAKPICERFIVSDATVEALADRLADAPRGLLMARDELAGWLKSFNA